MPLFGRNHQWKRSKELFAKRVEARNARGVLVKKVTIEPGTIALRIEGGIYRGFLGPGVHQLDDILPTRLEKRVTFILVDSSEVRINFTLHGIKTRDGETLRASGVFAVQILKQENEELLFLENFLQPNTEVSCSEIYERTQGQLRIALGNLFEEYDASDVLRNSNYAVLDDLQKRLLADMNVALRHSGLEVTYLDHVLFEKDLLADLPRALQDALDEEDKKDLETYIAYKEFKKNRT